MLTKSIVRYFAVLLTLTLLMMPVAAMAATGVDQSSYNKVNIWGVMPSGTVVYRDAQLNRQWGSAPGNFIMNVVAYKGDVALIKNGSKYGYCLLNDFEPLTSGTMLESATRTRVYQSPSTRSRHIDIKKGMSMEFVSLKDNCAEVRRGDYVGYVYIGHLRPANN